MAKKQINFRASELTLRQLEQLIKWWGVSQTEALTVAIDRVHREEEVKQAKGEVKLTKAGEPGQDQE